MGFSDDLLTIQNSVGEYVLIRSNGRDQLFVGEDALLFGDLNMTGAINGISDHRTKKKIRPIQSALRSILTLQGKAFEFQTEQFPELDLPEGLQFGLIAQEVEEVLPELVSTHTQVTYGGEDIQLKGVEYQALIPFLIEAIKEQNELITELRTRVDELEGKISTANK
ncbi:MAG: tail fiber domain-containing protein [Saprospiraceae bacterium]|nr:tail fiber domain-containing protein [Saprospiraceae bacterium]